MFCATTIIPGRSNLYWHAWNVNDCCRHFCGKPATYSQSRTAGFSDSTIKFELGISPRAVGRLVSEHMATFVVCLRPLTTVFACSHKDYIMVPTSPGCTCHIVGGENNILQMLAGWAEDHNLILNQPSVLNMSECNLHDSLRRQQSTNSRGCRPPYRQARRKYSFDQ